MGMLWRKPPPIIPTCVSIAEVLGYWGEPGTGDPTSQGSQGRLLTLNPGPEHLKP